MKGLLFHTQLCRILSMFIHVTSSSRKVTHVQFHGSTNRCLSQLLPPLGMTQAPRMSRWTCWKREEPSRKNPSRQSQPPCLFALSKSSIDQWLTIGLGFALQFPAKSLIGWWKRHLTIQVSKGSPIQDF